MAKQGPHGEGNGLAGESGGGIDPAEAGKSESGGAGMYVLPPTGEALLSCKQVAAVLGVHQQTVFEWAREAPAFPQPIRRGERFTRWKLSDIRAFITGLDTGTHRSTAQPARNWTSVRVPL